jgi:hypothetical protein
LRSAGTQDLFHELRTGNQGTGRRRPGSQPRGPRNRHVGPHPSSNHQQHSCVEKAGGKADGKANGKAASLGTPACISAAARPVGEAHHVTKLSGCPPAKISNASTCTAAPEFAVQSQSAECAFGAHTTADVAPEALCNAAKDQSGMEDEGSIPNSAFTCTKETCEAHTVGQKRNQLADEGNTRVESTSIQGGSGHLHEAGKEAATLKSMASPPVSALDEALGVGTFKDSDTMLCNPLPAGDLPTSIASSAARTTAASRLPMAAAWVAEVPADAAVVPRLGVPDPATAPAASMETGCNRVGTGTAHVVMHNPTSSKPEAAATPTPCQIGAAAAIVAGNHVNPGGNEAAAAYASKRRRRAQEQHGRVNEKRVCTSKASARDHKHRQPCLLQRLVAADVRKDRNLLLQVFRCANKICSSGMWGHMHHCHVMSYLKCTL